MGEDSDSESLKIQIGTTRLALGGPDHDLESYLSNRGGNEGTPRDDHELERYLKNRQTKGVKVEVEEEKMESVQSVAMEDNSDMEDRGEKKPRRMDVFFLAFLLVLSLAGLVYFAHHYFEIRKERKQMKRDLDMLQTVKAEKQNLENEVAKLKFELQNFGKDKGIEKATEEDEVFTYGVRHKLHRDPVIRSELLTMIGSFLGIPNIVDPYCVISTNLGGRTPFALAVLNDHKEIINIIQDQLSKPNHRKMVINELKFNLDLQKKYAKYKKVVDFILQQVITSDQRSDFFSSCEKAR